jgi:hypothetical protein
VEASQEEAEGGMTEVEQIAVLESKVENLKKESAEKTRALFVMSERLLGLEANEREVFVLRERVRQLEGDLGEAAGLLKAIAISRGGKTLVNEFDIANAIDPHWTIRTWRDERERVTVIEAYYDEPSDEGWYDE